MISHMFGVVLGGGGRIWCKTGSFLGRKGDVFEQA